MNNTQSRIYLASQSPRRRELLKQIGVHYEMLLLRNNPERNVDVDEVVLKDELPEEYVLRVCREKSEAAWNSMLWRNLPPSPVMTADTIVTKGGLILGKPTDNQHAKEILRTLSGSEHLVMTAVSLAFEDRYEYKLSTTKITFAELDEDRINRYIFSGEANDKAGAYGIQGRASAFIERIEGSYSGVVGLPLYETVQLLRSFGIATP
ncbi:MAG: Maf family protein [Sideroxydans sp.]|nr:Maf family protein [Sideroxydans sp.]